MQLRRGGFRQIVNLFTIFGDFFFAPSCLPRGLHPRLQGLENAGAWLDGVRPSHPEIRVSPVHSPLPIFRMDDIGYRTPNPSRSAFWSVVSIGFIVWLTAALGYGFQSWRAVADQAWLQLDATSALAESVTQQNLKQYLRGFDFLDHHLKADAPALEHADPQAIFALLRQFRRMYPDFDAIDVILPDGRVVADASKQDQRAAQPVTEAYLHKLRQYPDLHTTFPKAAASAAGLAVVRLGFAQRSASGTIAYDLVADIDLHRQITSWLRPELAADMARHLQMGLVTRQGDLLGLWPEPTGPTTYAARLASWFRLHALFPSPRHPLVATPAHVVGPIHVDDSGTDRMAWSVLVPLKGAPLETFVSVPRATVWDAWWQQVRLPLLEWALLGVLLALMALRLNKLQRLERQRTLRLEQAERTARQSSLFYAALAQTTQALMGHKVGDVSATFEDLATGLCALLQARLICVGLLPLERTWVDMTACAGPASDFAQHLRWSIDGNRPEGRGPGGLAITTGKPQHATIEAPEFAPWRQRAQAFGIAGVLSAAARTQGGEAVLVCAYYSSESVIGPEAGQVFQRMADAFAECIDRQANIAKLERIERYRSARRKIQRGLLEATDAAGVYRVLAQTLVAETGANTVEVFALEGNMLKRRFIAGPLEQALSHLTDVSLQALARGESAYMRARVWNARAPVLIQTPSADPKLSPRWREQPLCAMGLLAGWPILAVDSGEPMGVVILVARDPHAIDEELQHLVTNILESAALALRQVRDRQRIETLALTDALTGLPNRRSILEHIPRALVRAQSRRRQVAIGILDLDDFKPINDTWGHAAGDALLWEVGRRLQTTRRGTDAIARLGGDEFVVVLEDLAGADDLATVLDRLEAELTAPYTLPGGQSTPMRISLGLTVYPSDNATPDILLGHADEALYDVKARKATRQRGWMLWRKTHPPSAPAAAAAHDAAAHGSLQDEDNATWKTS